MGNEQPALAPLERYLRLTTASPVQWLAALRLLSGSEQLTLCTSQAAGFSASLSRLELDKGRVCGIFVNRSGYIYGMNADSLTLVSILDGQARLRDASGRQLDCGAGHSFLMSPGQRFDIELEGPTRALVVQYPGQPGHLPDGMSLLPGCITNRVARYLSQAKFWLSHHNAARCTNDMLADIENMLRGNDAVDSDHSFPLPSGSQEPDRRIQKVMELMEQKSDGPFELETLSSLAGVSTRNLYYLMRKHMGVTPYGYFQSRRLLRVRKALLACQSDAPTVSWHALSEGFSHLGRFASVYRNQFGENPRETLKWRESLAQHIAEAQPVDAAGCDFDLCLTSRATRHDPDNP
ncbi:AraC family transcriptional regulator [uncultured Marinobacter sp.]|uniref:AraC family transcriptional regulator n=1 Tax=uncultured Marinobacter sp. TaxID=187379 RepID=UPI0030D6E82C